MVNEWKANTHAGISVRHPPNPGLLGFLSIPSGQSLAAATSPNALDFALKTLTGAPGLEVEWETEKKISVPKDQGA